MEYRAPTMNTAAMSIAKSQLIGELERRRERKERGQSDRDARFGSGRVRILSYMENIGWPELFGYEMRQVHDDPDFAAHQRLRELIFWADNVDDDTVPAASIQADVGMYWDITLFGMKIRHTPIGVPEFEPHPLRDRLDLSLLGRFDFSATGDMPRILRKYARLREISESDYEGRLSVTFPCFHRGPLDIYIQLRGYEGFAEDTASRPTELRAALEHLVDERLRFARERQRFLGEPSLPATTFVADDWVNVPFISPAMFREFVVPLYRRIRAEEGRPSGFHTCGNMEPVVVDLVSVFPEIEMLEVSPWNDVAALDALLPVRVGFIASIVNTVTLGGAEAEQRSKLLPIRDAARRRRVHLVAQAIERIPATYEETLARLNGFLGLARRVFYA
jgi:hypothetical protein